LGNCPDGEEALIKPVSAWPGDTVTTTPNGVVVNGAIILNSTPNTRDPFGKDLHPYAYGNYKVPAGQLWVVSNYSARSFDSRYFGPIPVTSIRSWLKPVIVENEVP
jgi:conjugative transfer signal peptidase TraF